MINLTSRGCGTLKVRLIGDVHGKFKSYEKLIKDVPVSLQLGDMGVGFKGLRGGEIVNLSNPPYDSISKGNHRFIRGNHDNPEVCKKQDYWIPDGSCFKGMFCLGGAVSIDKAWRTEGLDWWPDEEASYEELQDYIDKYELIKPDIVCTHDCPESIAGELMMVFNRTKIDDGSRTRQALERMLYIHQPKEWYFGHWHTSIQFKSGNTIFQCLNELEYKDIEIND